MENQEEKNKLDWQGKSEKQVEDSVAFIDMVVKLLIITAIFGFFLLMIS